jgi:hypothetical protein
MSRPLPLPSLPRNLEEQCLGVRGAASAPAGPREHARANQESCAHRALRKAATAASRPNHQSVARSKARYATRPGRSYRPAVAFSSVLMKTSCSVQSWRTLVGGVTSVKKPSRSARLAILTGAARVNLVWSATR